MGNLVPILVPLGAFALVVMIRWLDHRTAQTKAGFRAESQKQLLEKFASAHELAQFLETEGGKRLLGELTSDDVNPYAKILKSLRIGVILTALGIGMIVLMSRERDLVIPGVFFLAIGVGFLIASGISYRLSVRWGLLKSDPASGQNQPITR